MPVKTYRKSITIDNLRVDADQTDFPVLVLVVNDADIGRNIDASGLNIRFTSSDGTTLLKYQRTSFSVSGGLANGVFFVKVPTVATAADTVIYIYFDNISPTDGADPTNVWNTAFKAVYHLEESGNGTSGEFTDSTSNAINGTGTSSPTRATGQIDYGQTFDKVDDAIAVTRTVLSAGLTYSAWIKTTSTDATVGYSGDSANMVIGDHTNGVVATFGIHDGKVRYGHYAGGWFFATSSASVNDGNWHHIAVTHISATGVVQIYVDGVPDGTMTKTYDTTYTAFDQIGAGYLNAIGRDDFFDGMIDEVRISSGARSASWLKFEYYNTVNGNQLTWGTQEPPNSDIINVPKLSLVKHCGKSIFGPCGIQII